MIPIKSSGEIYYVCPVCGNHFTGSEAEACQACPYARKCKLVMCPRCSYEFPRTTE
ncbi:hypothetical protein MUP00_12860 [Candidatus Bathyarchaeota archaeon]|nr:hypothetical protein [Candidatus Bathyarchaeota archaeon]